MSYVSSQPGRRGERRVTEVRGQRYPLRRVDGRYLRAMRPRYPRRRVIVRRERVYPPVYPRYDYDYYRSGYDYGYNYPNRCSPQADYDCRDMCRARGQKYCWCASNYYGSSSSMNCNCAPLYGYCSYPPF